MLISDLLRQYNNATASPEGMAKTRGVERLVSAVRELTAGNIFEGTVISIKNGQVTLGLSNGTTFQARMDGKVPLLKGESMFFQVKSNDGQQVAIRPFMVDGNKANYALMKALQAANVPIDGRNLSMVNTMMQEQMPIDKNSLGQMARLSVMHPDINVQTLVRMQKLQIPVNASMAAQFENYMDDAQDIYGRMEQIMDELPKVMSHAQVNEGELSLMDKEILGLITSNMEGGTQPGYASGLIAGPQGPILPLQVMRPEQLQQMVVMPDESQVPLAELPLHLFAEASVYNEEGELMPLAELPLEQQPQLVMRQPDGTLFSLHSMDAEQMAQTIVQQPDGKGVLLADLKLTDVLEWPVDAQPKVLTENHVQAKEQSLLFKGEQTPQMQAQETLVSPEMEVLLSQNASLGSKLFASAKNILSATPFLAGSKAEASATQATADVPMGEMPEGFSKTIATFLDEHAQARLGKALIDIPELANNRLLFTNGQFNTRVGVVDLLRTISDALQHPGSSARKLTDLFATKEVSSMIKDVLQQQWAIRPEELKEGTQVRQLYEHLNEQISKMETLVETAGLQNTEFQQATADVRGNIQFMEQINQMYTYVQLPLQMSQKYMSGQLFVYTNKKKLAEQSENKELTAFLHLDLDHLGSTDVSVKLLGKEVSTNFYLNDDESFALVKEHLPILEQRLKEKGYSSKLSVINEEKHVNFVQDFLKKDQPSAGQLHRYSFDMRA